MARPLASVQLYTLAEQFSADMAGSLDRLAGLGLRNVEAFDFVRRPAEIRAALDSSGLAAPTGHAPLLSDELWTPDGSIPTPAPEVVFDAAAEIGMTTVIDPFVAPERWRTLEGVTDIAERLNTLADTAAGFGLTVGYHNHAQEFVASFDDQSAYERFVALTDPRVALELDLFWALTGGQDVVSLVERLGERLVAVHVKDGVTPATNPWEPGAPAFASSSLDQRHAGTADVPLADALRAATSLKYAVIEYDHAPGDVFDDIAASLAFLTDGGFVR
ncbi:sugar phosphate isomerase/epimerase family protein [Microbacterium xanthum]|uniref:sugar phosphate isomerase/epimerase family protein n=1 Tax=Microbacterium xanthum TaxID=3079794 RepID=UPI002AD4FB56|nr:MULTISPECIES: sugar phosphate isomerase/epimerase [unclassified Microbacterium]MDZ8171447.1 sugar phosphate isomerase/epimerase [Microbacterium sp. KSW-48]MDZ8200515.1 sugar phosphate isomerase/epimerase [Microbacterium sp. SSW1-59]